MLLWYYWHLLACPGYLGREIFCESNGVLLLLATSSGCMQFVVLWGCIMVETVLGAATHPSLNCLLLWGRLNKRALMLLLEGCYIQRVPRRHFHMRRQLQLQLRQFGRAESCLRQEGCEATTSTQPQPGPCGKGSECVCASMCGSRV